MRSEEGRVRGVEQSTCIYIPGIMLEHFCTLAGLSVHKYECMSV